MWRQADKYEVPRVCFCQQARPYGRGLREGRRVHSYPPQQAGPYPIQWPIGAEANFVGIIDLIRMKAEIYKDEMGQDIEETDVPAEYLPRSPRRCARNSSRPSPRPTRP